ncbi:MAG: endonuclease III [Elusimicrobiota bacterium]
MTKNDRPKKIFELLEKEYPQAKIKLNYKNPWQLLVATILSAQCTDKRVNIITKDLFKKHPRINDYLNMSQQHLIKHIKSAGLYRNKAKNILNTAKIIIKKFNGKVPDNLEDLVSLPGIARKTANVILGNAYNKIEGIAVDTHVKRLSYRLDLTYNKNPDKIEKDLMKLFPKNKWYKLTYLLIEHGRKICKAPAPVCFKCLLNNLCPRQGLGRSF